MEAGGGAFNPGAASPAQKGRRKTRRAGKKGKDARHRKVAQKRGMTDERRAFEVGEVLHALVFQLSVADVSFLPLEELGEKPKLHDDGLGDFALQERRAHWMTEPYLCASLPIRPGLQCRCRCCTEDRDGWSRPCPRPLCVAVSDEDCCGGCRRCIGGCSMRAGTREGECCRVWHLPRTELGEPGQATRVEEEARARRGAAGAAPAAAAAPAPAPMSAFAAALRAAEMEDFKTDFDGRDDY